MSSDDRARVLPVASTTTVLEAVDWPEEQRAFYRTARDLAETEALEPARLSEQLQMAGDLGLMLLLVPVEAGGPGHGLGASLLAIEAIARAPAWALTMCAIIDGVIDPLMLFGGSDWNARLLRFGLTDELAVGSVGKSSPVRASPVDAHTFRLDGTVTAVPHAAIADRIATLARTTDEEELSFFLPRGLENLDVVERASIGGTTIHDVHLRGVQATVDQSIRWPAGALARLALLRELRHAFVDLGAARALLAEAVRSLRVRHGGSIPRERNIRRTAVELFVVLDMAVALAHTAGRAIQRAIDATALPTALAAHARPITVASIAARYARELVVNDVPRLAIGDRLGACVAAHQQALSTCDPANRTDTRAVEDALSAGLALGVERAHRAPSSEVHGALARLLAEHVAGGEADGGRAEDVVASLLESHDGPPEPA